MIRPKSSGTYTFYANSDDGVRLWVNGQLLIDSWITQASELTSLPINLMEGQNYELRIEYSKNGGSASFGLVTAKRKKSFHIRSYIFRIKHTCQWNITMIPLGGWSPRISQMAVLPAMNMTQREPDNGSQMIYRTAL